MTGLAFRKNDRRRTGKSSRQGAVLIAALVCLLVVMSILGSMLQGAIVARRQLHAERDLRQTELLLQAGVDRAAFRLAGESDYRGETWEIPAEEIIGLGNGRVTIAATRASDTTPWQLDVIAEYPVGSQRSVRRSGTFFVQSQPTQMQE